MAQEGAIPGENLYHRSPQRTQRKNNKMFSRASRLCVLSVLLSGKFFHFERELLLWRDGSFNLSQKMLRFLMTEAIAKLHGS